MSVISTWDEMLERDKTIQDFTINGKCSNCGNCCNDMIPLTKGDIHRIKIYIEKNNIKPIWHGQRFMATATLDAMCPFRDDDNKKCIIYSVRPAVCKAMYCNNYYEEFIKNRSRFKDAKLLSCRMTFFEKENTQ
jgi:Fe-S-cluster containining protein